MFHEKLRDNFLMQLNPAFEELYSHLVNTTIHVEILDGEPLLA